MSHTAEWVEAAALAYKEERERRRWVGEGKEGACCVIRMHVYSCLQHLGFAYIRDEVCGPMEMLNILCETSLKFCCAL